MGCAVLVQSMPRRGRLPTLIWTVLSRRPCRRAGRGDERGVGGETTKTKRAPRTGTPTGRWVTRVRYERAPSSRPDQASCKVRRRRGVLGCGNRFLVEGGRALPQRRARWRQPTWRCANSGRARPCHSILHLTPTPPSLPGNPAIRSAGGGPPRVHGHSASVRKVPIGHQRLSSEAEGVDLPPALR
jgi:hypothetical protein